MCNTHTADVDATVAQCLRLAEAGAQIIRITVPSLSDVSALEAIRARVPAEIPLVADIHFSDAHPHIGTDKLPRVIENMRNTILQCLKVHL